MKKSLLILTGIIIIIAVMLVSCRKQSAMTTPEPDTIINEFFAAKLNYVQHFDTRGGLIMPDIFTSDELKNAVRYKFLDAAEFGRVQTYNHTVTTLPKETITNADGSEVIPATERVISITNDPTAVPEGPINRAYTDKFFFTFVKAKGSWKIAKVEILKEQYEPTTFYSSDVVMPYNPTDTEMAEAAKHDPDAAIRFEERKIWELFFDEKINLSQFDAELYELHKKDNILPNSSVSRQSSLNKSAAVAYATKWTDNTGGTGTSSYNKAVYTNYSPNDCADYMSQCLYAGGWTFANPYTNSTSYSSWWYNNRGTTATTTDDVASDTWVSANGLCNYICETNHYAAYTTPVQVGAGTVGLADLIWQPKNGIKTHVMMVTAIQHPSPSSTTVSFSAHTNNRLNAPWTGYSASTDYIFGHF
jgi:hypothetical protein